MPPIGSFTGRSGGSYLGTSPSDHLYGCGPTLGGSPYNNGLNNNYNSSVEGSEQSRPTGTGMTPLMLKGMPSLGRVSIGNQYQIQQVVSSSDSQTDNNSDTANHIRGGDAAAVATRKPLLSTAASTAATNSNSRTFQQYAMVPLGPPKKWVHWVSCSCLLSLSEPESDVNLTARYTILFIFPE